MEGEFLDKLLNQRCLRFGEIAVGMGFVTAVQVKKALTEQVYNYKKHRLLGQILLDKGWITDKQVEKVLSKVSKTERKDGDRL